MSEQRYPGGFAGKSRIPAFNKANREYVERSNAAAYQRGHEISRDCPCDRCDAWYRTHGDEDDS